MTKKTLPQDRSCVSCGTGVPTRSAAAAGGHRETPTDPQRLPESGPQCGGQPRSGHGPPHADVRAARMHMARAAKRLRERPQDQARFIAYDDAWTAYCVVCEERYFNLGFDHGTRTGVAWRWATLPPTRL